MSASSTSKSPTPTPNLTAAQVEELVSELINEKSRTVPARVQEYLTSPVVKSALDRLVQAGIPLKDIQRGFIDKLDWKVSPRVFRAFMKETYDYPPAGPENVGAKKSTTKRAGGTKPARATKSARGKKRSAK